MFQNMGSRQGGRKRVKVEGSVIESVDSHKTAVFSTEQCTSPSLFSRFEVTQGNSNRSLKNYGFLYDAIFSSRVRMCTNHLERNVIITQDC